MRVIAGALLIVAASVCFAAGVVALATKPHNVSLRTLERVVVDDIPFIAASVLGLFGLVLLWVRLTKDRQQ